jgi:NTE family protein
MNQCSLVWRSLRWGLALVTLVAGCAIHPDRPASSAPASSSATPDTAPTPSPASATPSSPGHANPLVASSPATGTPMIRPDSIPVTPAPDVTAPASGEPGPIQSVTPPPVLAPRHLRIGLALGGGAARGFAHIGVIKALEARGIVPDIVVGTSAGSVVGALYAGGFTGNQLNRLALSMDEAVLSDWSMSSRGVLKGESLEKYINQVLKDRPIEKLERKFGATATDLRTGQLVLFERGNAGLAVRASSSVPGVFQPVLIAGREYVDGGLVSPVPVRAAKSLGADIVIAVDISARPAAGETGTILGVLRQTFAIMGQTIGGYEMHEADIVLIPKLSTMAASDFQGRNDAVLAGEEVVALNAQRIKDVIEAKRRELNAL